MVKKYSHPKVLFLTTADGMSGTERIVVNLAREFTTRDWAVQNVFPRSPNSDALLAWCREQGVNADTSAALRHVEWPHSRQDILALRKFVRESNPDVVNLHYGTSHISLKDVLAVRLAGRHRCIVTSHTAMAWKPSDAQKRRMTRLAAHLAHAVIVNSRATRDVLWEAGVPKHKTHVIPCGMHVPKDVLSRVEARAQLGLPPGAFVVNCHARLVAVKGIDHLIEAAARIPDPHGELRVVIAGDGPERPSLECLAAARLGDRAIFLGHRANTDDLYAAADVFALPSTWQEAFGLVYVEAAFHGIPSVGTSVGGVPDVIADGETGLLVPPGDRAALTAALQRLRDDPALRLRLGEAARARAHAEFTETTMADRYVEIFQPCFTTRR